MILNCYFFLDGHGKFSNDVFCGILNDSSALLSHWKPDPWLTAAPGAKASEEKWKSKSLSSIFWAFWPEATFFPRLMLPSRVTSVEISHIQVRTWVNNFKKHIFFLHILKQTNKKNHKAIFCNCHFALCWLQISNTSSIPLNYGHSTKSLNILRILSSFLNQEMVQLIG